MPRVSVIIPTFNCASYVGKAVNSVLAQTYRDYEVIVIDDGSSDNTADVLGGYGDKIRYVYQTNRGVSAARNHGLGLATGEFIAYLDADDMWYEQKLDRQTAFLDAHADCGFVHSEVSVIDEHDQIIHMQFNADTRRPVPQGDCRYDLLQRSHIQTLTVLERRSCIDKIGGFDERLPVAQDYMHWIRIVLEGWVVGYIAEPLGKYRWRNGSLMGNPKRLLEDYEAIYSRLLKETILENGGDTKALRIAEERLRNTERELAYIDSIEGRGTSARRRIAGLIQQSPFQFGLYLDLAKAYLRPSLQNRRSVLTGRSTERH